MNKRIIIIDHFSQTPNEKGNNRFIYLADKLAKLDYAVEIVTTDFSHKEKKTRNINSKLLLQLPYKYTMIKEPGYPKNVCLRRFYSHYIFGRNLKKYLSTIQKPDLVYIAVPSLDVGFVSAKYCNENDIPFFVDIQDLWPEAFKIAFNIPILSSIMFSPLTWVANIIYSYADKLIAVSQTYLNRGLTVNKKDNEGLCVFLGTDLENFDKAYSKNKIVKPEDEVWIVYIGTLGHSYNINIISDSIAQLYNRGYKNIVFKVLGDGPLMDNFKNHALDMGISADFLGRMHYEDMVGYLAVSDFAVNPITKGAAQSIINKHGDYAAAGLPVISTQENSEYRELLETYECGINCAVDSVDEVANAIEVLIRNNELRAKMRINSRKLAEEKFDRRKTNLNIISAIKIAIGDMQS